jgi:hypothetical protein
VSLVKGLPLNCAFARSVAPEYSDWRTTEELLATLIEVVDQGNRMFLAVHAKKGAEVPKPLKIPRPRDTVKERKQQGERRLSTPEEVRAVLGENVRHSPPTREDRKSEVD